jgi:DNA-3-methyladenine glycosylase
VSLDQPLPRSFYARSVLVVARDCIGKYLVHDTPEGRVRGRIVEAEAYRGPEDRAAHSYGGRRTPRTEAMFGPAGHAYVFFVYGQHWHFNLVTTAAELPHAVLIRAVEPLEGQKLMATRRGLPSTSPLLCNGPGKLCQAFAIDRAAYGCDLTSGPLFLSDGPRVPRARLARSPRIGIDYAEEWALRRWRYYDSASSSVSRARARQRQ